MWFYRKMNIKLSNFEKLLISNKYILLIFKIPPKLFWRILYLSIIEKSKRYFKSKLMHNFSGILESTLNEPTLLIEMLENQRR